jgi:hypothetical protein
MRAIFIASLLCVVSTPAYAYLDPGTGSIILQGLIATIAVAGLTIKTYWHKILSFFGKDAGPSPLDVDYDNLGQTDQSSSRQTEQLHPRHTEQP